jgi:putative ABC transport system permease protein
VAIRTSLTASFLVERVTERRASTGERHAANTPTLAECNAWVAASLIHINPPSRRSAYRMVTFRSIASADRRNMSLIVTLASRNLFQDRLRFIAALTGIVFSVVLVMVQLGLYFGFGRMLTMVIDHAPTDLWIVSSETQFFEDLSILDNRMRDRLIATDGVSEVVPVVAGFSVWMLPEGGMTSVFVIASDIAAAGLSPWNITDGTLQSLIEPGTVAIDRSYAARLGAAGVGASAQIRGQPVTVGAVTAGIRSFTTTPYVFSDLAGARAYLGLPASFTTHFLVRLKPGADLERARRTILSDISGIQALTPGQFREKSRSFWLFRTGAGAALVAGALLAVIVGTVIVAQTLYSSTKEHLYEFATLRAMGASNSYIYKVIVCQALLNTILGLAIAALIGIAVVRFTVNSIIQIAITPNLVLALFILTVVMCIVSAIASIARVVRVDPAIVLTR